MLFSKWKFSCFPCFLDEAMSMPPDTGLGLRHRWGLCLQKVLGSPCLQLPSIAGAAHPATLFHHRSVSPAWCWPSHPTLLFWFLTSFLSSEILQNSISWTINLFWKRYHLEMSTAILSTWNVFKTHKCTLRTNVMQLFFLIIYGTSMISHVSLDFHCCWKQPQDILHFSHHLTSKETWNAQETGRGPSQDHRHHLTKQISHTIAHQTE